jgi:hypothetical protein
VAEGVSTVRRRLHDRSPIERALRYIAGQRSGPAAELLKNAIEWPSGDAGTALQPLIQPTELLQDWTSQERAAALVRLLGEGVEHPSVGPGESSRERRVLRAAFRFADPDVKLTWAGSLAERWEQLKVLNTLFPHASTTQPMEAAWTRGVRKLAGYIDRAFREELTRPDSWQRLRNERSENPAIDAYADRLQVFREPSIGAQPFFVERFVVTVYFVGPNTARRITERVVTARADEVEFYTARAFSGRNTFGREYVPVRALWGCRAEPVPSARSSEPLVTRLWFPRPLRLGEQASFATEAIFDIDHNGPLDRHFIDVDVDHHGIALGRLHYNGTFPLSGLTIRARFDQARLPAAVWWYAETTEQERLVPGDDRLLPISADGEVAYTFTETVGQPRESYGVGYAWQ